MAAGMRTALLVSVLLLALGASDVLAKSKPAKHKKPTKDPKDSNKRVFAIFGGLRHPRCARWRKTYIVVLWGPSSSCCCTSRRADRETVHYIIERHYPPNVSALAQSPWPLQRPCASCLEAAQLHVHDGIWSDDSAARLDSDRLDLHVIPCVAVKMGGACSAAACQI